MRAGRSGGRALETGRGRSSGSEPRPAARLEPRRGAGRLSGSGGGPAGFGAAFAGGAGEGGAGKAMGGGPSGVRAGRTPRWRAGAGRSSMTAGSRGAGVGGGPRRPALGAGRSTESEPPYLGAGRSMGGWGRRDRDRDPLTGAGRSVCSPGSGCPQARQTEASRGWAAPQSGQVEPAIASDCRKLPGSFQTTRVGAWIKPLDVGRSPTGSSPGSARRAGRAAGKSTEPPFALTAAHKGPRRGGRSADPEIALGA